MPSSQSVSVVMPYYRNERTLVASLKSFAAQQQVRPCEIIVVDDGSPISAQQAVAGLELDVPLRLFRTERVGQAAATNVGLRAARGDIVLMTCADIIAAPRLTAEHWAGHAQGAHLGVMGYIPYAPNVKMTPFMQYLRNSNVQFGFSQMLDPNNVSGLVCYAPNLSVGRCTLLSVGGFDEAFPYGFQDSDLGVRLQQAGVRFVYRKAAVGFHDHPNTLQAYLNRQEKIGRASLRFVRKHGLAPMRELVVRRGRDYLPRLSLYEEILGRVTAIEASLTHKPQNLPRCRKNLSALYGVLLNLAMLRGELADPQLYEQTTGLSLADYAMLTFARAPAAPADIHAGLLA